MFAYFFAVWNRRFPKIAESLSYHRPATSGGKSKGIAQPMPNFSVNVWSDCFPRSAFRKLLEIAPCMSLAQSWIQDIHLLQVLRASKLRCKMHHSRRQTWAAGWRLQVAGSWLTLSGCRLQVAGCRLRCACERIIQYPCAGVGPSCPFCPSCPSRPSCPPCDIHGHPNRLIL